MYHTISEPVWQALPYGTRTYMWQSNEHYSFTVPISEPPGRAGIMQHSIAAAGKATTHLTQPATEVGGHMEFQQSIGASDTFYQGLPHTHLNILLLLTDPLHA